MNIIICGLTAAGKTTHCKLLVNEFCRLNYKYFSMSTVLLSKPGNRAATEVPKPLDYWISDEALELNKWRRQHRDRDKELDLECKEMIDNSGENWVVDALSTTWFSTAPALRIWLESSLDSRVMKAIVSYRGTGKYSALEVKERIQIVDKFNREYFLEEYGIDFLHDKKPFDFVIDISEYIQEPSQVASQYSIRSVQAILNSIVNWKLQQGDKKSLERLFMTLPKSNFLKVPDLFYKLAV